MVVRIPTIAGFFCANTVCTFLNWYILIFPLGITGGFIGHNAVAGDDITSNRMASASI